MKNYIILNGKISTTIQGLLIQNLPPISKPRIRTEIEEIDGRDGDIITPLGYAAYDKTFSVGLYGDFDINEIIAYFNTSGTVIFSNEPDKYYNYQIIDQIDFERLIRFRTAEVRMHVQPFKYSAEDNSKSFSFDTANKFNFSNWYNHRSALSVSGGSLEITENNLTINGSGAMLLGTFSIAENPIQSDKDTIENFGIEVEADTTYNFTATVDTECEVMAMFYDKNYSYISRTAGDLINSNNNTFAFTTPNNCKYVCYRISNSTYSSVALSNILVQINTKAEFDIFNAGNIYSKPIITISGSGNIGISLNNVQLFQIALGVINGITIDTTQMEAYNGNTLLNRLVNGDYDNFKLNIGKNTIKVTGSITGVVIKNYSRWI